MRRIKPLLKLIFNQVTRVVVVCAVVLLIGQQGCASKPVKSPILADSGLSGARIGVVIKNWPEGDGLKPPEKGVSAEMGRGVAPAVGLMMQSAIAPSIVPIVTLPWTHSIQGMPLSVPELLIFGTMAAGGAIYYAVASPSASTWNSAEAIFRTHLIEQNFDDLLRKRLIAFAQECGCAFEAIDGTEASAGKPMNYENLSRTGIGLVLELSEPTIQLQAAGSTVNPPRRFFTSVRAKVFRTNDGTLLDDRIVIDDMGEIRPLDDWMLNNGIAFREQIPLAAKRTAEMIVSDLFLPPSLPERPGQFGPSQVVYDFTMPITVYGLKPIYPPPVGLADKEIFFPRAVSSLQPTMQWEPYEGDNVTYDLIIWRGRDRNELTYSREGLSEAFHTLETPLQPNSFHVWTVRARYTSGGLIRTTEWATWSGKPSPYLKVMSLGVAYLLPDLRNYYFFFTK